jgi:ubiquinone biosynthesis monooxygenase Coq7
MKTRTLTGLDRLIGEIDRAIKVLSTPAHSHRELPAGSAEEPPAAETARRESGRLMRVNHAGEISAQALYQGQALTARASSVAATLRQCAAEEMDHLAWCEERLAELNTRTSLLNPVWYAGSFALGALAGALGDRTSLGFIAETERQVEAHLRDHQKRLPPDDRRSRAILEQMTEDEVKHGATAASLGGYELPFPVKTAMRLCSRVMTRAAYWV